MQLLYTKILYLLFGLVVTVVQSYKILVVFHMPGRSHYLIGNALGKGLAKAGHEVTFVSPFEEKNPPKNYKEVVLTGLKEQFDKNQPMSLIDFGNIHPWVSNFMCNLLGSQSINMTFQHPNFQKILNQKFDVIVIEEFKSDALKALSCHFNAPLIMFNAIGAHSWTNKDVANPSPPSYVPDIFLSYTSKMNLWQRTFNSLTVLLSYVNTYILSDPTHRKLIQEYFPECVNNDLRVSLYFINAHESSCEPVPRVPNMIYVGGFHISPPKELPKDLKEYLDNAKDGVIYFSMGSNIKFTDVKPETREALNKAFGKLKQKILWKYDGDTLPGKPDNVMLGKWFPQADILAHPNVKLFVTHGGFLSTLETIYHGVPVLALPVFGDQKLNAARSEAFGYGLALPFSEINEEKITYALNKLLNDPKYRENAKFRSTLSHDRPMKPMDEMVYWTEFIARHKGAPHLMVAGINLPWYQYLLLDVILLVILIITTPIVALYLICKKLCCSRKDKTRSKKKKD